MGKWVSGEPAEAQGQGGGRRGTGEPGMGGLRLFRPSSFPRGCLVTDLHLPDCGGFQAEGRYGGQPQPCPKKGRRGCRPGPRGDLHSGPRS